MLEPVIIVLNERETYKAKIAEELSSLLGEANITASRLEIDSKIQETILAKEPRVLILDYLLGDYTTGLDVLTALKSEKKENAPEVIFLTDEPSISVAVDALRLGARHYVEIDNPQAVTLVVQEIREILKRDRKSIQVPISKTLSLGDLIAQSPKMARAKKEAELTASRANPICIIFGPPGSGKETVANAIQSARSTKSFYRTIDLASWDGNFDDFFPCPNSQGIALKLGQDLSLCIQHAEYESGKLLNLVSNYKNQIWPSGNHPAGFLTICTSCPKTLEAWKTLCPDAAVIQLPELGSERSADIPPLVQRFSLEAKKLSSGKISSFDSATTKWLQSLNWPGGLTELEAVIIDSLLASANSKQDLRDIVEERRAFWDETHAEIEDLPVSKGTALRELQFSKFDYRIAAARLGCNPMKLREVLNQND